MYNLRWCELVIISYKELRELCALLEATSLEIEDDNLSRGKEIRLLQSDDKYLEKVIRNRLNFVRENEILYIFPGGTQEEPSGGQPDERKETEN